MTETEKGDLNQLVSIRVVRLAFESPEIQGFCYNSVN
jgi:hypothetical protein